MEVPLHCNTPGCRASLTERAVVTTCSHVFCLRCADETGLSQSTEAKRQCPACKSPLFNPDDAVRTVLQPTEDYKTSVLSGLDPTTIMECAGRALAFWTYQNTQEIAYQESMGKTLTEKYTHLSRQFDKMLSEANTEMDNLRNKIGGLVIDQKSLHHKNNELIEMYREKSKKHAQTQHLYDTLKKKIMMTQVQTAASDDVTHTLRSMVSGDRPGTYIGHGTGQGTGLASSAAVAPSYPLSLNENGIEQGLRYQRNGGGSQYSSEAAMMPPPPPGGPLGRGMQNPVAATPQHRTHLPGTARAAAVRSQIPMSISHGNLRPPASALSPLPVSASANRNFRGNSNSYGISAAMKVGTPSGVNMSQLDPRTVSHGGDHNPGHSPMDRMQNDRGFNNAGLY